MANLKKASKQQGKHLAAGDIANVLTGIIPQAFAIRIGIRVDMMYGNWSARAPGRVRDMVLVAHKSGADSVRELGTPRNGKRCRQREYSKKNRESTGSAVRAVSLYLTSVKLALLTYRSSDLDEMRKSPDAVCIGEKKSTTKAGIQETGATVCARLFHEIGLRQRVIISSLMRSLADGARIGEVSHYEEDGRCL